ncbi:hypothetical protein ER308_12800 [Egibacter rhizosphaerae]|uniref:Amidohydrolase-related domain-containing protein n=1 Tax=Egibacter rhizosphaerae TaxID=1670831 RepID=A0A411YGR7_9ACTN|nr:amidohydrolase family protein [Egibacter rhizosphaerae]QBI20356.1 hypothetical protein ER308_12800 [Egibacter rhizosphaerae]
MPPVAYRARVVVPVTTPPIDDGVVVVDGDRIVAVGSAAELSGRANREHSIDGALLPGLVNARTRIEHTDAAGLTWSGGHDRWLAAVAQRTRDWDEQRVGRSAQRGVHALLRAGVTCAGDVVGAGPAVPAAVRAGLVGDSWVEVADVDERGHDALIAALERTLGLPAPGRRVGIALPGPHRVGTGVLQALADLAARRGRPIHLPAAVTRGEVAAIAEGTGPTAAAAVRHGLEAEWLEGGTGLPPLRYLDACGVLRPGTSIAHAMQADPGELDLLAERGVSVVVAVRAAARTRLGGAPLHALASAGLPVALGTDDPAASGDVDALAEARAFASAARVSGFETWPLPGGPRPLAEAALRLVTADGARAMGWGDHSGALAVGRRADLVGVELDTDAEGATQDVVDGGAGRQVLTVVAGVRRARRRTADEPWPAHDPREEDGTPS